MKPPFLIDVVALRRHYGHREHVEVHAPLTGMRVTECAVPDDAPVDVVVVLEAVEGGIVANGTVAAPWVGECRRCLATVEGRVETTVQEVFVPDSEEGETYPIDHDRIDLAPLAREAIVLALPLAPLCRPDCRGLCATCGADLNAGACGCEASVRDPRWAALDSLRETP